MSKNFMKKITLSILLLFLMSCSEEDKEKKEFYFRCPSEFSNKMLVPELDSTIKFGTVHGYSISEFKMSNQEKVEGNITFYHLTSGSIGKDGSWTMDIAKPEGIPSTVNNFSDMFDGIGCYYKNQNKDAFAIMKKIPKNMKSCFFMYDNNLTVCTSEYIKPTYFE